MATTIHNSNITTTREGMSFNPSMHGPANPTPSSSSHPPYSSPDLQRKLQQQLGPEYVSTRPGPGNHKLTYVEGWKIINLANEVFGYDGWSSNIVSLSVDYMDFDKVEKKYHCGVSAVVRVTLVGDANNGASHEDVGFGQSENAKSKAIALDKCKKEAVTDGLKRALRSFGNLMGNCLYDKDYTREIGKIKAPTARFNKSDLHRRPEFAEVEEQKPQVAPDPPPQSHSAPSKPPPFVQRSGYQQQSSRYVPPPQQLPAPQPQPQKTVPQPVASTSTRPLVPAPPHAPNASSSTAPTDDDCYDFGSDDVFDALDAEADLGPPIHLEEEDNTANSASSLLYERPLESNRSVLGEPFAQPAQPLVQRQDDDVRAQRKLALQQAIGKSMYEDNGNSTVDESIDRSIVGARFNPPSNARTTQNRIALMQQAQIEQKQNQNQNQPQSSQFSKRPDTATGSFNFPASILPVKRSADGVARKPAPGMGLAREPLGILPLDHDGRTQKRSRF